MIAKAFAWTRRLVILLCRCGVGADFCYLELGVREEGAAALDGGFEVVEVVVLEHATAAVHALADIDRIIYLYAQMIIILLLVGKFVRICLHVKQVLYRPKYLAPYTR